VDVLETHLSEQDTSHALGSWAEERQSAWLYRRVSDAESGTARQHLFLELAAEADRQAGLWAARLAERGVPLPAWRPSLRARLVARLLRYCEPATLRPLLAALKVRGMSVYVSAYSATGQSTTGHTKDGERRHRVLADGNDLRAVVFGVNDGLVSNLSLMFGMAGSGAGDSAVVLAGVAGLLAGSLSMAAGEYVSVRAQRELHDNQIALERAELDAYPEAEASELATIFEARGMGREAARQAADALIADPDRALATLAREELGLDPDSLASPWRAALASFFAFCVGATIPLLPFTLATGMDALAGAVVLSSAALMGVGALVALFSGGAAARSALRMLAIGLGAAAVTWMIGRALGVAVG
jgi:VIT1/CCC1 family predicted Fe2+/Mn2+ transporter